MRVRHDLWTGIGLMLATACSGCMNGSFRGSIVSTSSGDIQVVRAVASRKPGGIVVSGDVRRRDGYAGPVPGYLHVVGMDAAGNVVATANAPWGQFMNRRLRQAYFKGFLKSASPTSIVSISVVPRFDLPEGQETIQ